jgi:hypothetical protein
MNQLFRDAERFQAGDSYADTNFLCDLITELLATKRLPPIDDVEGRRAFVAMFVRDVRVQR